jgi:hypothetical protein
LDAIEKAIRGAFEKGDAEDKAFREKVYRSAFAALDRALQANPNVTVETAIARRKSLQAKITEIESEFIPAVPEIDPAIFDFSDDSAAPPAVEPATRPAPSAPAIEPVAPPVAPAAEAAPKRVEPAVPTVDVSAPTEPAAAPAVEAPAIDIPSAGETPAIEVSSNSETPPARPAGVSSRTEPSFAPEPSFASEPSVEPKPSVEPVAAEQDEDPTAFTAPDVAALDMDPPRQPPAEEDSYEVSPDPDAAVARERRRPYAAMFIAVTLFVAAAMGLWWAAQTGLLKSPAERDTSVPNPPATAEAEDFIPEDEEPVLAPQKPGETDELKDWITVFSPADASQVSAPSDTSAEVVEGDEGPVLRIRSGTSGSAILFDVGQGLLEQIAGKRAIFDIVARAEEGQETQISVSCNFGELGDCGRKRYAVGHERGEFLFEIELPTGQPGAGGTIAISSDISNQGKAVDISEIKVSVE